MHLHQKIREDIEGRIMSGEWSPGHRLPSEHDLMEVYGCSRMTVNKVLSSLAARGLITRRRRAGSVVAAPSADRAILEIQDFALEARRAHKTYRHEILRRTVERADAAVADRIGVAPGTELLCLQTLHRVEDEPEAFEDRIINLAAVPDARGESFEDVPPGTWLLSRVPWTDAEHVVSAINADSAIHKRLKVAAGSACLVLERRTWQAGILLTEARIVYPGARHRLVGRFSPGGAGRFPQHAARDAPGEGDA